jgi:hypothetical protein
MTAAPDIVSGKPGVRSVISERIQFFAESGMVTNRIKTTPLGRSVMFAPRKVLLTAYWRSEMPTSYSAADALVDFQSDHTGAAAKYSPTAQIPIANAALRACLLLKRNLLMVLVCTLGAVRSLLEGNEYALRGTGLVAAAQRRYPYV